MSYLIDSHLTVAHDLWRALLKPGDRVVDATLGNGQDALILAETLQDRGTLIGYDIQETALIETRKKLSSFHTLEIQLHHKSHALLSENELKLVVYNLGYLPGSDKTITTLLETTLESIQKAERLLLEGGAISITLYPGHEEGKRESDFLLEYVSSLPKEEWLVTSISWPNRKRGPSLLFLQKRKRPHPS